VACTTLVGVLNILRRVSLVAASLGHKSWNILGSAPSDGLTLYQRPLSKRLERLEQHAKLLLRFLGAGAAQPPRLPTRSGLGRPELCLCRSKIFQGLRLSLPEG